MTALHETVYPQLKPTITAKELELNFMPTEAEMELMLQHTRKSSLANQLGFMIMLKSYQCLGRPVSLKKTTPTVKKFIAKAIHIDPSININPYYQSSSRKRHIKAIRNYLQIKLNKNERRNHMKKVAMDAAATKENLADIINAVIEELIRLRYELPAFRDLLRLARAARRVVNHYYYNKITDALSLENKLFIDKLLTTGQRQPENITSLWAMIKQDPQGPTTQHIKHFIQNFNEVKKIREQVNVEFKFIPAHRFEQFFQEAMAIDAADMRKLKAARRYALAVILIHYKVASSMDDLVNVLVRWIRKLHTNGKKDLDKYRLENVPQTDNLIELLYNMLMALKIKGTDQERITSIENCLVKDTDITLQQCEKHMDYANDNYFSFMLKPYRNKRHVIFQLLDQLFIQSTTNDTTIKTALAFIRTYQHSHKRLISVHYQNTDDQQVTMDLNWLPEKWFKAVTGKSKETQIDYINRHYFELAVLTLLVDDLNCGDAYVEGAYFYDDPNKQLISWEQFYQEINSYCELIKLPSDKNQFIDNLQNNLRKAAKQVDEAYKNNEYLSIRQGEPTLKKATAKEKASNLDEISQRIADKMPLTTIVDIIVDTEKWLNLSCHFKPHSGYETKIQDYASRFVATSYSYGCNVGPTQAERSLQKFSRKQIAWLFNHHINEFKLNKVLTKIINVYNQFDLPKKWGTGENASVDGTYWDMYTQNLLAAHHIRYGGYGGLGYYHISDQYIALFSNFIPCGVHEAHYLFDAIISNESDIQPDKIQGDTGAQSEVVFAFAFLLAIQLMPRIRNFKHLRYYKASKNDHFNCIDELFTEQTIDWELIKTHYHDMLRIVISIRAGKIKASTILRKLCSKSRKNKLYFAFRELGRVIRTIFLLNYINDIDLRQMIQAATCKSEEFNQFINWIMYGGGGIIADNMRYNQQKIIKYGHVVANMVILHVVAGMTRAINELKQEGYLVSDKVLQQTSPFRTDHINRFGVFLLNLEKDITELEYSLV